MAIRIVTDSTASIPAALCAQLQITVVAVTTHFGDYTFVDGVDPLSDYYDRLASSSQLPTTSTPSPGAFQQVYQPLVDAGHQVVSVHVMDSKSSTYGTACLAASMLPPGRVHVVDSQAVSMGLGMLVLAAARAAQQGATAAQVVALVRRLIPTVHLHATIADLTQLRRSGRVALGKALLASLLAIKPVLYAGQSLIEVVDKARGLPVAVERMVALARERAGDTAVRLTLLHTNNLAGAQELQSKVQGLFNAVETLIADAGPALATHAGPGALGIATMVAE